MAGIIGIYGLVVSVLVANDLTQKLPLYTGFIQLGAGLAVGLAGLAAGYVSASIPPTHPPDSSITDRHRRTASLLVLSVTLVFVEQLNSLVSTLE